MKKHLTILTGIVFAILTLVASGCNQGVTKEESAVEEEILTDSAFASAIIAEDPTKLFVSVEDTFYDGRFHLIMQNYDRNGVQGKKVVDNLETTVYPGNVVYWNKSSRSELHKINFVRIVDSKPWGIFDECLVGVESDDAEDRGSVKFIIPPGADTGIVKYEIVFTVKDELGKHKKKTWCIDPHLRIPPS